MVLDDTPAMIRPVNAVRSLIPSFREAVNALKDGTSGTFRTIRSFPSRTPESVSSSAATKTVCILDSSFNPPTKAHMHLAIQALQKYTPSDSDPDGTDAGSASTELLLLLATSNVDKSEAPAPYEQRIAMMCLLAQEIQNVYGQETGCSSTPQIDIGITKHARFIDKSTDLGTHELYPKSKTGQVWILGYDTLIRLLNTKYYPPKHTLTPVYDTLLSGENRILVFARPGDDFGTEETQKQYYESVDKRVADKLDLISTEQKKTTGISSTNARNGASNDIATGASNTDLWMDGVCKSIAGFIEEEKPYRP